MNAADKPNSARADRRLIVAEERPGALSRETANSSGSTIVLKLPVTVAGAEGSLIHREDAAQPVHHSESPSCREVAPLWPLPARPAVTSLCVRSACGRRRGPRRRADGRCAPPHRIRRGQRTSLRPYPQVPGAETVRLRDCDGWPKSCDWQSIRTIGKNTFLNAVSPK